MVEDKFDDLIRQLASRYSIVQKGAALELGDIAEKNPNSPELVRAVTYLVNALTDQRLKNGAVCGLKKIGKPAVPTLISALKNGDGNTRWYLAWLLGEIKDARVIPALVETLNDRDSDVGRKAWDSLISIGKPTVPALVDALKDKYHNVRREAAEALGKIGDVKAVPALVEALKDENWRVRVRAAEALWDIAEKNPGYPEVVKAVPALVDALKDKHPYVRENAARLLGKIFPVLTEAGLGETEKVFRKSLEKAEGKEIKVLVDWLEKITERRNKILEPEVKKLKLPKIRKRKKPRRIWRLPREICR